MTKMRKWYSKKELESSTKRYDKTQEKAKVIGTDMFDINDLAIKAEYDTWSWYYGELSTIRLECFRIGSAVRLNNKDSWKYLRSYNSHIYALFQWVMPVLKRETQLKVYEVFSKLNERIDVFVSNILNGTAASNEVDWELIRDLDFFFNSGMRLAQLLGLGFRTTFEDKGTIASNLSKILAS